MYKWEVEFIPDSCCLYYRVNKKLYNQLIKSEIRRENNFHKFPGRLFRFATGAYLSVDWSKYSNPKKSQNRAKKPKDNGIIEFNVRDIRRKTMEIYHIPSKVNRAHSGIYGEKAKVQMTLERIAKWSKGFEICPE